MPIALAWDNSGRLTFGSLDGRVMTVDGAADDAERWRLREVTDAQATPYGLAWTGNRLDVITKPALIGCRDADGDGFYESHETLASGWGHTDDYHDWAVGLPRDAAGRYYIGTGCQMDQRSLEAARWRGNTLRLTPREPSHNDPRRYAVDVLSTGHRYPMGIALNHAGELFVTDNQGHYNPFNELNHVRGGADFGFVNRVGPRTKVASSPPAINIPHPWTRSVNGICFLEGDWGPFRGHLVGCEYDLRSLVRMSLQQVGTRWQGAVYPFTRRAADPSDEMLGPIGCAVGPRSELWVSSLRESGWGAGSNVGELWRLRFVPEELPTGIAEVRAWASGFDIAWTRPIEATVLQRAEYHVESFTRVATPEYGGDDRDRREERVVSARPSTDGRRVRLRLSEMRPGFVYELRVKLGNLDLFPHYSFYSLWEIPSRTIPSRPEDPTPDK